MKLSPEQAAVRYYDAFNTHRQLACGALIDTQAGFHYPHEVVRLFGYAGYLQIVNWWTEAFPDGQLIVRGLRVSGDHLVAADLLCRGTHTRPLPIGRLTLPPSGGLVEFGFREYLEVHDGRITDVWLFADLQESVRRCLVMLPDPRD